MKKLCSLLISIFLVLTAANFPEVEFSGKLILKVNDEEHVFERMTRSNSRLSFQKKGIAIYIVNPEGEGTIAEITILSPEIYESNSHNYELGADEKPKTMMDIYQGGGSKNKNNLSFRFRKIDQMDKNEYIQLNKGTVELKYDDKEGNIYIKFEGEDKNGTPLSGSLSLEGAYLMDSRD